MGQIAVRTRELLRQVAMENEIQIISGKVSVDHVHMFVSYKPQQSVSKIVQFLKR
jgi:putative transposase